MNKETAEILLMEYLYDEISDADKQKLDAYVAEHPEMRDELDELRGTQSILQEMPEPGEKIRIIDTAEQSTSRRDATPFLIPQSGWARTALAAAACVMLLLVTGALVDLNIQSNAAGFSVSFGAPVPAQPKTQPGITEEQVKTIVQGMKEENSPNVTREQIREMVETVQQENEAILTEYAAMLNQYNERQMQQFAEYFQHQRLNDLQTINEALTEYQEATSYQIEQTQEVLGEVIQTVASNN